MVQKNGRIVWINGNNGTQIVMGSNLSQHDGRPSLEAANFDNRSGSWDARGEQPEESSLALPEMPRYLPGFFPRIVKNSLEVARNLDSSQCVIKALEITSHLS
jgi:hypothetical protein